MLDQTKEDHAQSGPYVHLDYSFQFGNEIKYAFKQEQNDDDLSLGSSVSSGLRNSLHSAYSFRDLHQIMGADDIDVMDSSFASHVDVDQVQDWRLDPEESQSDWTMVIESVPDGAISEYHVHKRILSEGPKKSKFFESLFRRNDSGQKTEEDSVSTSKMHAEAAKLVPDMLDYLYSINDMLDISTETAVALRHLSEFFGIRALATEVVSFVYYDMSIQNMKTYIVSASAFDDLQTLKLCAQRCAVQIMDIDPTSHILAEMDPSFLLDVISNPKVDRNNRSSHISKLVSIYCHVHRDTLNGGVFEELTSVEYLPTICKQAAFELLSLEAKLVEDACEDSRGLTYLQKRCVDALAPLIRPNHADKDEQRSNAKALKDIPKKVLVELLSRSMSLS